MVLSVPAILDAMDGSLSQAAHVKPGGHELRREVVVHHQRERILVAVIDVVAERGYRATSVAQIIKAAGVAKLKFYELFDSKQDAFLVAFDSGLEEAAGGVREALDGAGETLAERVDAGLTVALAFLDERPSFARAAVLEAPSLGGAMGDRRERTLQVFTPLFSGARGSGEEAELPGNLEESVLDGIYWLLYEAVLTGKPKKLTKLRPALVEFALLPFLGPLAAASAAAA
jgi:AcrR family transcriptional regulator